MRMCPMPWPTGTAGVGCTAAGDPLLYVLVVGSDVSKE